MRYRSVYLWLVTTPVVFDMQIIIIVINIFIIVVLVIIVIVVVVMNTKKG